MRRRTARPARPQARVLLVVASAVAVLALSAPLALALPPPQIGGIIRQVALTDGGRVVHAKGTFRCGPKPAQRVSLRITISQQSTGAVAEGHWKHTCTGNLRWSLTIPTSTAPFTAGAGQGTGRVFFARQWLNQITLS